MTRAGTEEAAAVEDTAGAGAEEEMGATVAGAAEEVATVAEAAAEGATVAAAVMEEVEAAEDTAGTRSSQTTRSSCRDCPQTPPRKTSHSSSVPSE